MKRKFLFFEVLLAAQVTLKAFLPSVFTWKISLLSFGALSILKGLFEGYRLHWFFFPLAGILSNLPVPYLPFVAIPAALFPIIYYPLFKHLKPKGSFLPGFRELWINDVVNISVYYPTNQKGPDSYQFASKIPPWKNFHDSVKLQKSKLPLWYAQIGLSYLKHWKLGVNTNTPIVPQFSPERRAFPVIVFSHGMATGRNDYSFYLKELASRGYIIVSPDHSDIVYPPSGEYMDFPHRNIDLRKRLADLQTVLNFVHDPHGLKKLFDSENIEIDLNRVSAMGHSFGAGSATYLTFNDQRITGACINLDPWYFAIEESAYKEINRPLLTLTTKAFGELLPENKKAAKKLAKMNENYINQTLVGHFEQAFHNNMADNGFFMPRELEEQKGLGPVGLIKKHFRNHSAVVESFLEVMVVEREDGVTKTKEDVWERVKTKKYFPEVKFIEEDLDASDDVKPKL